MRRFQRSVDPAPLDLLAFAMEEKENYVGGEAGKGTDPNAEQQRFGLFDYEEEYTQALARSHVRKLRSLRACLSRACTGELPEDLREKSLGRAGLPPLDEPRMRIRVRVPLPVPSFPRSSFSHS